MSRLSRRLGRVQNAGPPILENSLLFLALLLQFLALLLLLASFFISLSFFRQHLLLAQSVLFEKRQHGAARSYWWTNVAMATSIAGTDRILAPAKWDMEGDWWPSSRCEPVELLSMIREERVGSYTGAPTQH